LKYYCRKSFHELNYKCKQMCDKSKVHLCMNVSKDLKLLNWTYRFKSKKKGKSINENYRNGQKIWTSLIFWSKRKNMKQTCYISIWNWQCYITVGEVLKLVSTRMGGDCCTFVCHTSPTHPIPHTNRTVPKLQKVMFKSLSTSKLQACSSNNMNIFCLTMVLIWINWQVQFHYRMFNNRKGGWGINHL
jgi:hypothetical protein